MGGDDCKWADESKLGIFPESWLCKSDKQITIENNGCRFYNDCC